MNNYETIQADLMTARANGQNVDGGLAALEELRRDMEFWDWMRESASKTYNIWHCYWHWRKTSEGGYEQN